MAKDFIQDIVPPTSPHRRHPHAETPLDDEATPVPIHTHASTRSIRNIAPPARTRHREHAGGHGHANLGSVGPRRSSARFITWGVAALSVLLLLALLAVALRPTRVTVTPRTHTLTFAEDVFTAEPAGTVAPLTYAVETMELEDSEVVQSSGVVYAEDKASGNVTVYNNYQAEPLTLVKNTRFASVTGLIFRTPADVVIPGKKGSTPGSVQITVVADQPGEQYNVPPGKFNVPGLKSTAAMYAQVYAESTAAFSGGFVGERPGVAAGALESAIAAVRGRLQAKAIESVVARKNEETVAFPELVQIEYESLPNTSEDSGGVRVRQRALVRIPVFDAGEFAAGVGSGAIGAAEPLRVSLVPAESFGAVQTGTSTVLGAGPLRFALRGSVMLVWKVQESELQKALAGKDKSAFEAIVSGYPAIQEARARIEPFWKSSFPADPNDIKITVERPEIAQ